MDKLVTHPLNVAFRCDASVTIGNGHVMRCLTLADSLRNGGATCAFVVRNHPGNLADQIASRGFGITLLAPPVGQASAAPPVHAAWAGVTWQQDAEETRAAIGTEVDWIVVDHYAFDACWERAVAGPSTRIMVIDDLADRPHEADLLLDQNLGRMAEDYDGLVPEQCQRLIGPRYALLRPEFAAGRAASMAARLCRPLRHILVTMGGTDAIDATSRVLDALAGATLPTDTRLTVVMGRYAPALRRVQFLATGMPWPTEVAVDVSAMADLMADADLAIGAGGSTNWERCCMGLPGIIVETAANQADAVAAMQAIGAAYNPGVLENEAFGERLRERVMQLMHPDQNMAMVDAVNKITDGKGADGVSTILGVLR